MSCERYRKFISDELDGELDAQKAFRLAAHLEKCSSCRLYKAKLIDLQHKAGWLKGPSCSESYWEDFSARLKAKLRVETGEKRQEVSAWQGWRFAWAAGAALLAVGLGLAAFLLFRPAKDGQEMHFLSFESFIDRVYQEIGPDERLVDFFNLAVMDFVAEEMDTGQPALRLYFPEDPLFIESLGEEEVEFIGQEIERETKSQRG